MTKKEFMSGVPFSIKNQTGTYQFTETVFGGELLYINIKRHRIKYEVIEINEKHVSYACFNETRKINFADCIK